MVVEEDMARRRMTTPGTRKAEPSVRSRDRRIRRQNHPRGRSFAQSPGKRWRHVPHDSDAKNRKRSKEMGDSPVVRAEEARLLVLVTDRAKVAPDDLPVGILADVVLGHLEHAEVEVGDGAEGAACNEDDRLLVWITEGAGEAVRREGVVGRVGELGRRQGW